MKVKSEREVAQWCPTLSDPMDCSLPGSSIHGIFHARVLEWGAIAFSHIYAQACLNNWLLANFGMPMTTHPYQATEKRKTLTTGGPGKEQGTNKLPPTRILQRSTRGQEEMADCSPEVLATSILQQRPSIVKTNSMLQKISKQIKDRSSLHTWLRLGVRQYMYGARKILKYEKGKKLKTTIKLSKLIKTKDYTVFSVYITR